MECGGVSPPKIVRVHSHASKQHVFIHRTLSFFYWGTNYA
jgi:hypothetical protein